MTAMVGAAGQGRSVRKRSAIAFERGMMRTMRHLGLQYRGFRMIREVIIPGKTRATQDEPQQTKLSQLGGPS